MWNIWEYTINNTKIHQNQTYILVSSLKLSDECLKWQFIKEVPKHTPWCWGHDALYNLTSNCIEEGPVGLYQVSRWFNAAYILLAFSILCGDPHMMTSLLCIFKMHTFLFIHLCGWR